MKAAAGGEAELIRLLLMFAAGLAGIGAAVFAAGLAGIGAAGFAYFACVLAALVTGRGHILVSDAGWHGKERESGECELDRFHILDLVFCFGFFACWKGPGGGSQA